MVPNPPGDLVGGVRKLAVSGRRAAELAEAPALAALPDYIRTRGSIERFELGLQTVLDGIEQQFREAAGWGEVLQ